MNFWQRVGPGLAFFACVALTTCALLLMSGRAHGAEEVPRPLLNALLTVETGSFLRADGSIYYLNRADGAAGETGPFQISRVVCRQHHFNRERMRTDTAYGMRCAVTHLEWLHDQLGTWDLAAAWNGGLSGRNRPAAVAYAARVKAAVLP